MNTVELQAKYSALAVAWRPLLDVMVHPMNPDTTDEKRVFVLMEIIYRTFGARPGYAKLCWQTVYGDTRPFPEGLQAPSEWARIDNDHRQRVIEAGWDAPGTVRGLH